MATSKPYIEFSSSVQLKAEADSFVVCRISYYLKSSIFSVYRSIDQTTVLQKAPKVSSAIQTPANGVERANLVKLFLEKLS